MIPLLSDSSQASKRIRPEFSLDVLIGGGGEKDTTITSSFPIAYSIVCSARAKPGGSYSRAWARAYGHFVFAIRIR